MQKWDIIPTWEASMSAYVTHKENTHVQLKNSLKMATRNISPEEVTKTGIGRQPLAVQKRKCRVWQLTGCTFSNYNIVASQLCLEYSWQTLLAEAAICAITVHAMHFLCISTRWCVVAKHDDIKYHNSFLWQCKLDNNNRKTKQSTHRSLPCRRWIHIQS